VHILRKAIVVDIEVTSKMISISLRWIQSPSINLEKWSELGTTNLGTNRQIRDRSEVEDWDSLLGKSFLLNR
jgi:hypothetical protein